MEGNCTAWLDCLPLPLTRPSKTMLDRSNGCPTWCPSLFNKKVERNKPLPDNVIRTQQSRCDALCLCISLEFPDTPPGDGDGLCDLRLTWLHGVFVNDQKVDSLEQIKLSNGST